MSRTPKSKKPMTETLPVAFDFLGARVAEPPYYPELSATPSRSPR